METTHTTHGRCKSGQRWFWYAAVVAYDYPRCGDPVCTPGLHPHEYGWEDTEDQALKVMAEAVARFGGEVRKGAWAGNAPGSAGAAAGALKRINATRRRARPPKRDTAEAAQAEYLYEPWSWSSDDGGGTHKGINEIPVTRKTAKRIYYDRSDSWDTHNGVITEGYIDRQDFEADTRCKDTCPRTIPAGMVCAEHSLAGRHCVHWGQAWDKKDPGCRQRDGCSDRCPEDTPGLRCAIHPYTTWDHCPHNSRPGDCWRGYPAGCADRPGRHYDGGPVYATREAAEDYLYQRDRERERKRAEAEPELKRLRMAMADAHPDRGGTDEGFIAARKAYEQAMRRAS
jgi:hypothetical protein